MQKQYLLNLIESDFKGYKEYQKNLTIFIEQLMNEHNFELAKEIKKIQDDNWRIIKNEN